jgi:hypothetical protein
VILQAIWVLQTGQISWVVAQSWHCCVRLGSQNWAITGLELADSASDRRGER